MIQKWCERKGTAGAQMDYMYSDYNRIYRILHYLEGGFAKEGISTAEGLERI